MLKNLGSLVLLLEIISVSSQDFGIDPYSNQNGEAFSGLPLASGRCQDGVNLRFRCNPSNTTSLPPSVHYYEDYGCYDFIETRQDTTYYCNGQWNGRSGTWVDISDIYDNTSTITNYNDSTVIQDIYNNTYVYVFDDNNTVLDEVTASAEVNLYKIDIYFYPDATCTQSAVNSITYYLSDALENQCLPYGQFYWKYILNTENAGAQLYGDANCISQRSTWRAVYAGSCQYFTRTSRFAEYYRATITMIGVAGDGDTDNDSDNAMMNCNGNNIWFMLIICSLVYFGFVQ